MSASAIDAKSVVPRKGSNYPPALAARVQGREKRALGDVFQLTQFGVNLTTLPSGASSALRHWHAREDEFVYVVEGELTLIDDHGEHVLTAGMCAGFKGGVANGHCLVNRSQAPAAYLEIGSRFQEDHVDYPEEDLMAVKAGGKFSFVRKDGSPY
jgi:uncharacterized cupin superfamily protein